MNWEFLAFRLEIFLRANRHQPANRDGDPGRPQPETPTESLQIKDVDRKLLEVKQSQTERMG